MVLIVITAPLIPYLLVDKPEFNIFKFHLDFIWVCTCFFSRHTLDNSSSYYYLQECCLKGMKINAAADWIGKQEAVSGP